MKRLFLLLFLHKFTYAYDSSFWQKATEIYIRKDNTITRALETSVGNGQRSNMSTWVPVKNGKFYFRYRISTEAGYPIHSSYGINLTVQA